MASRYAGAKGSLASKPAGWIFWINCYLKIAFWNYRPAPPLVLLIIYGLKHYLLHACTPLSAFNNLWIKALFIVQKLTSRRMISKFFLFLCFRLISNWYYILSVAILLCWIIEKIILLCLFCLRIREWSCSNILQRILM